MTMGIKKKANVSCDVCKLTFSSQVVLDTHLTGHKHQRRVKAIEMFDTLKKTESCFELDSVTGDIRCNLCDVTLNSPQHLTKHIVGEKHLAEKGKRENGEQGGTPAKKPRANPGTKSDKPPPKPQPTRIKIPPPAKKERPPLTITIPAYVTKVEDNKAGGKFLCNPCQSHCNSDIQLTQHLASKKHLDKVSGKKKAPPAGRGSGRGWRGGSSSGYGGGRGSRGGRGRTSLLRGPSSWNTSGANAAALGGGGSSSSYNNNNNNNSSGGGGYNNQSSSAFPETIFSSSNYSDSYGLSSLGRSSSSTAEYDYGYNNSRSGAASGGGGDRGWGAARADGGGSSYGRDDSYSQQPPQEAVDYGRGTVDPYSSRAATVDPYSSRAAADTYAPRAAADPYPRADYGADYGSSRQADAGPYSRAPTEYATHGYMGAPSVGHTHAHAPVGNIPYTYTPPLSQNFVGGGTIL